MWYAANAPAVTGQTLLDMISRLGAIGRHALSEQTV